MPPSTVSMVPDLQRRDAMRMRAGLLPCLVPSACMLPRDPADTLRRGEHGLQRGVTVMPVATLEHATAPHPARIGA